MAKYKTTATPEEIDEFITGMVRKFPITRYPPENELQTKVEKWFEDKGYICLHPSGGGKKYVTGTPDIIAFLPGGRSIWMELKSHFGSLQPLQRKYADKLKSLGHEWHLVRTYEHFLEIMEPYQ